MELSSLSDGERVQLAATWYYAMRDEFQCRDAEAKLQNRPGADKLIEELRKRKYCYLEASEELYEIDGFAFKTCVCHPKLQIPGLAYYMNLTKMYGKGVLAEPGSLNQQPAKLMEVVQFFQDKFTELEKEAIENAKK